jgi:hypothetical protein
MRRFVSIRSLFECKPLLGRVDLCPARLWRLNAEPARGLAALDASQNFRSAVAIH